MKDLLIVLFALVCLAALLLGADWLWSRATYCTDSLIRKDSTNECQTVAHVLEYNPNQASAVCRCPR